MKMKDLDTKKSRLDEAIEEMWMDEESLNDFVKKDRLAPVLVRCGGGRFTCPAQDAKHFIRIITEHNEDYVRDVSRWDRQVVVPHSINCEGE